jgi:hypothetical protein
MTTGKKERAYRRTFPQLSPFSNMRRTVAANDTIIMDTEKNKNENPSINLLGRECLKSASRNGDVRIERNITTDVKANERDNTSVTVKTTKKG